MAGTIRYGFGALLMAGLLAAGSIPSRAQERDTKGLPEEAVLDVAEEHTTAVLPEASPHWLYVLDPVFPHLVASKVYVIDGDSMKYLGMLNTGYVPNMALAPDRSEIYVAETYYSRGTRGERVDVVTFYDAKTLEPTGEVELPDGRFLVVPKKPNAVTTPDGRYLLSFNMEPATSVDIVDLEAKRYLGAVEVPGCSLIFPTGDRSFSMLCPDGSLLDVRFDESGAAEIRDNEPFFDSEADPVFEHAVVSTGSGRAFFLSYEGVVYEAALGEGAMRIEGQWSLLTEEDRAEKWRPGGWQLMAYHPSTNRLFVLMHEGDRWTHKEAGEEVWVFDVKAKKRVARVPLEHPAISVSITQDEQPLLFTLSEAASVSVFDGTDFSLRGTIEGVGDSPFLMYVQGE